MKGIVSSRRAAAAALILGGGTTLASAAAFADVVSNPVCPAEQVQFNPGNGEDIVVANGYRVEVFAKGLNFPTDVAFLGSKGTSRCWCSNREPACRAAATTTPRSRES